MSVHRFLPLLVVLLTSLSTYAYDFQSGDLYYNITGTNTVEVTSQKHFYTSKNYDGLATATIPETVTYKNKIYSVTSIGNCAFDWCSSLTSVILPNSVTSIGARAFGGCDALTSITIPNSVISIGDGAFHSCSALTSITFPNSVTSIGEWAFGSCYSLTSVILPNSVTSIGGGAFAWCSALTAMVVESGNTTYDSRENCNAIIETATNTLIAGCQSTIIPNSVTNIGEWAFGGCYSLTSVILPNSVTSIGDGAFNDCSSLTSITIPNSVTSIGDLAFGGCYSLTSIILPNSVTSIGEWAFGDVPNIVYHGKAKGSPWGAKNVNGYVDGYLVYADDTKTKLLVCSAEANGEITIPNSVTSIEDHAFGGCSALTSIILPNSVKTIGKYAFSNVPNIVYHGKAKGSPWGAKSVNGYVDGYLVYADNTKTKLLACSAAARGEIAIPNSVTSIGDRAFQDCRSLTSITIPNSVKHIGSCPFSGCNQLKDIYCYATTPPNCYYSFGDIDNNCRIHVPESTINSYRVASGWCVFKYFYEVSEE